jgi:hypothetical protein
MQVLVVGGEHAFVHGTFASKLGSVGVRIGAHWDWTIRRPPQIVPKECGGVVVLHDMVGHHLSNAAKDAANTAGIPFALVPRKFSAALPVLRRSGIVSASVPDEPTDETEPPAPPQEDQGLSDLRSGITMILESHFDTDDIALTDMVSEIVDGYSHEVIYREVMRVRQQLLTDWSVRKRSAAAERSLVTATSLWVERNYPNPDESTALNRIKTEAFKLFGTPIPEKVLVNHGFQPWELRGLFTRDRVRNGIRTGDQIVESMTSDEFEAFRKWVVNESMSGKKTITACPLKTSVRGLPFEGLTIMLRAVPDLSSRASDRIYHKMSGAGLGPYYHNAAVWGLSTVPAPLVATAAPPVEVASADPVEESATHTEPVAPSTEDSLAARIVAALFGTDTEPSIEMAVKAREALDAVNAAAESVASGGGTSTLDALVRAKAADIIAARDIADLEEKARSAEAAFLKAQEEFHAAQAAATEARNRIAVLRGEAT